MTTDHAEPGSIDLYWIPLGAGGSGFVRLNGRVYEAVMSRAQRRAPLALCHTALRVHVPEGPREDVAHEGEIRAQRGGTADLPEELTVEKRSPDMLRDVSGNGFLATDS